MHGEREREREKGGMERNRMSKFIEKQGGEGSFSCLHAFLSPFFFYLLVPFIFAGPQF